LAGSEPAVNVTSRAILPVWEMAFLLLNDGLPDNRDSQASHLCRNQITFFSINPAVETAGHFLSPLGG
jgi:hypothetical protein